MRRHKNQHGITLLETVVVLLIGGLVISGIWIAYSQVTLNQRVQRTINATDKTIDAARDFLSNFRTAPPNFGRALYDQSVMPPELKPVTVDERTVVYLSPLGANFIIGPAYGGRLMSIAVNFRTSAECVRMAAGFLGSTELIKQRSITGYEIDNIRSGTRVNLNAAVQTPTSADISRACNANGATIFILEMEIRG